MDSLRRSERSDVSAPAPLRVGGATIDPLSREAEFCGGRERLSPQNLKVLIALAAGEGRVVTRSALVDLCWDGRIVGDDVVNHSISQLRGFAARAGGFSIETVPKSGYRLAETIGESAPPRSRMLTWSAIGAVTAIIAIFLITSAPTKQGDPPIPTVALIPFVSPSGDAVAAEVARAARVSLSHMLSEGGFPVRLTDVAGDSSYAISGDISRGSGLFQANVRLVDGSSNVVIFTRRFEAADRDASKLADRIGASVAANLSWTGALMALDRRRPIDPQITSELLKQMSITVEGGDILRAYEISREVAPKAPNSAIAQVSLAFNSGFALGALPRDQREEAVALGRAARARALALAPEFGDSYASWCFLHSRVRRLECEAQIREGMRADPDAPFTATFLSSLYSDTGRFEEALELSRVAIANDRYKTAKLFSLIRALHANGRSKEANDAFLQTARWWPGESRIAWGRMLGLIENGDFAALEALSDVDPSALNPAQVLAAAVRRRDVPRAMQICRGPDTDSAVSLLCLVALAELGRTDAAFAWADMIYPRMKGGSPAEEEKLWLDRPNSYSTAILSGPATAALRRDPRFLELARRLGLLDYWREGRLPDFCRKRGEPVCAKIRS